MKKYLFIVLLVGIWSCEEAKEDDTTPPNITITFIAEGSVSEMVSISCISTDNESIEKVELWINGVATSSIDITEPYSLEWNTTTYEDGSYVITVRSYDTSGNVTDSDPITLTIDNSNSNPTHSELYAITYENNSFSISWSQNNDDDFESYTLYEALSMDMSDKTEIFFTNDVSNTNYVVNNVPINEYRQYQVKTTDIWGLISYSSVVTASSDTTLSILDITLNINEYVGQLITIDGIVTVPAGLLRNNFTEVYIQDWSSKGIVLYNAILDTSLKRGDYISVTAEVDVFDDKPMLIYSNIDVIETGVEIPYVSGNIEQINIGNYDYTFVKVTGEIISRSDPFGTNSGANINIQDSFGYQTVIRIWNTTNILFNENFELINTDMDNILQVGNTIEVYGIGGSYAGARQIQPAFSEDITLK